MWEKIVFTLSSARKSKSFQGLTTGGSTGAGGCTCRFTATVCGGGRVWNGNWTKASAAGSSSSDTKAFCTKTWPWDRISGCTCKDCIDCKGSGGIWAGGDADICGGVAIGIGEDCRVEYCWCDVGDTICWPGDTKADCWTGPMCTTGEAGSGRWDGRFSCAVGCTWLAVDCCRFGPGWRADDTRGCGWISACGWIIIVGDWLGEWGGGGDTTTDCCADCDWLGDIVKGGGWLWIGEQCCDWALLGAGGRPWFWSGIQCWDGGGSWVGFWSVIGWICCCCCCNISWWWETLGGGEWRGICWCFIRGWGWIGGYEAVREKNDN